VKLLRHVALRSDTCSAMGASEEDFQFVVEDVAWKSIARAQPEFEDMKVPDQQNGGQVLS
jgi:hypothetical protein